MIRLRVYSVTLLLILCFFVVSAEDFGEIVDSDGNMIEPSDTTDYGGLVYTLPDKDVSVNYDGTSVDYTGLSGSITFSEFGKVVAGDVTVDREGEYVFGNMKLDLKEGSSVSFVDGELLINDPGSIVTPEEVSFVDEELSWEEQRITFSGEGVDFHGESEVSLDKNGYFLESPKDVSFDSFRVSGEGNVYFFEGDGNPDTGVFGAYVSVNKDEGFFSIGSNSASDSVAVKVNSDNSYGLRHDGNDHVAFKSVSNGDPSYIFVRNRDSENLIPRVEAVGFFAIDNNGHGSYRAQGEKVYTTYSSSVISEFSVEEGVTPSPIEVGFHSYNDGKLTSLSDYDGSLVIGNDGHIGYGSDPTYTLAGKYNRGNRGREGGSELRHGASNLLAYNYYQGDKETIEQIFGFPIIGNRVNVLEEQGKEFMDILFQTPEAYRKYVRSVELTSSIRGNILGMADTTGRMYFAVDQGGFDQRTISHELAHIFDFSIGRYRGNTVFKQYWNAIGGDSMPVISGAYTRIWEERVSTFVEMQYRSLDNYWKPRYYGDETVQKRVAALILGEGITYYNGKRILEAIGAGSIDSIGDVRYVIEGGLA